MRGIRSDIPRPNTSRQFLRVFTYTAEEEISLSEIIRAFNDRHGTQFTKEDFLRFERVNHEIMDGDMVEMLRNNPPDVVFSAFSQAFFKGAIRMFQRDAEMKNIVLADATARNQAIRHFFGRALREAREDYRTATASRTQGPARTAGTLSSAAFRLALLVMAPMGTRSVPHRWLANRSRMSSAS
jgi:hypothetical protein